MKWYAKSLKFRLFYSDGGNWLTVLDIRKKRELLEQAILDLMMDFARPGSPCDIDVDELHHFCFIFGQSGGIAVHGFDSSAEFRRKLQAKGAVAVTPLADFPEFIHAAKIARTHTYRVYNEGLPVLGATENFFDVRDKGTRRIVNVVFRQVFDMDLPARAYEHPPLKFKVRR